MPSSGGGLGGADMRRARYFATSARISSRWNSASPYWASSALARLKYMCRSYSQVKPMPPWTWMASLHTLREASPTYDLAMEAAQAVVRSHRDAIEPEVGQARAGIHVHHRRPREAGGAGLDEEERETFRRLGGHEKDVGHVAPGEVALETAQRPAGRRLLGPGGD